MVEKFRYGTKEIIVTIIGSALAVATQYLELALFPPGSALSALGSLINLRIVVIAAAAVFFGPVAGMLTGLGGELLLNVMFSTSVDYPGILVLGAYGFFIGYYFGKRHYEPERFAPVTIVDFNAVQIMIAIFLSMIALPLSRFIISDINLYDLVITGAKAALVNSVIVGIIVPILMGIVYLVLRLRSE